MAFFVFVLPLISAVPQQAGSVVDGLSLEESIEQSVIEITRDLPKGTRVAIAAFTSEHANLSNYIMDELAGALVDCGIEVADRRNLEYVYKELGFQMSGEVSDQTAVSIGKFLGARYVVTGQLAKAGDRYRYRLSGINVETAVQESSARLNIRDDSAFRRILADLRQAPAVTIADFDVRGSAQPTTAGVYLDRGLLLATRGDYETAIEDFTEAINLDAHFSAAYMLRGRALVADASDVIVDVGENFSSVTSFNIGAYTTDEQRLALDRAIADFTQAIRLDSANAAAYKERGDVYYHNLYDYDRAIADFTQAIRLDPNNATFYISRGNVHYMLNDERAITDYTQAIRIDPINVDAYRSRGYAYRSNHDLDRAFADWTQAIRLDPNDPNNADVYSSRGIMYEGQGDYDRAIADYTQAIRVASPKDSSAFSAYCYRGGAYEKKGDYDRAIADYTKAIMLAPPDFAVIAYVDRGGAYEEKGDYDRAIADFEAALQIDSNATSARDGLERVRRRGR
jgi:tetratricopeptide (TPR) repeat protein